MINRLSLRLLCQIYALLVLLAVTFTAALPYALLALALLLAVLYIIARPAPPGFKIAIMMAAIFLLPLTVATVIDSLTTLSLVTTQATSSLSTLPVIYLLDYSLRQNTQPNSEFIPGKKGRHTTRTFIALCAATLVMMLVSIVLSKPALLFTGIIFVLYLLVILLKILLTIPRLPVTASNVMKRIIAGTTSDINLNITSKAKETMHILVSAPEPWMQITPPRFTISRSETARLNLSVNPLLSGPTHLPFRISALDSRGLVQINQTIEPLELQVIPRAQYAEWLARKYLEQTGTSAVAATSLPPETGRIYQHGTEYYKSRSYQAGDQMRDIDWKHTLKLSQLIVKECIEAGEKAAIIAVNLSVGGAEEADILAFNLITAALTLAREGVPTSLAAYNHEKVIHSTAVSDPAEILRQTMSLVKEITAIEFTRRHLELPDLARLRNNITHLKKAESEPARKLLGLLDFEYLSVEEAARNNPATLALLSATEHTQVPTMIVLISLLNHDAEALLITTEKLASKEFITIPLPATHPHPAPTPR